MRNARSSKILLKGTDPLISNDAAGHARAKNLGGSGSDNKDIFPQDRGINRGKFNKFEGDSKRPSTLNYKAVFDDGTKLSRTFTNGVGY